MTMPKTAQLEGKESERVMSGKGNKQNNRKRNSRHANGHIVGVITAEQLRASWGWVRHDPDIGDEAS